MATDTAVAPELYGPRLYEYLEAHWRRLGTNANAWVNQHPGIQGPTVSRWRNGSIPSLANFRAVADALGVSMLDVLIASGVVDESDAKRPASTPEPPTIEAALAGDPSLTDVERRALRDMLGALRQVQSGATTRVTGRTRRR